jgi:hypothetical protein
MTTKNKHKSLCQFYISAIDAVTDDPMSHHPRLSLKNLSWLCREADANLQILPDDKAGRWIGFVEGCLTMRGLIAAPEKVFAPVYDTGCMTALQYAQKTFFDRYLVIIQIAVEDSLASNPQTSLKALAHTCHTISDNIMTTPDVHAGRSLGFVQGCLAMRGHICVDEERAASRPYFHQAYKDAGTAIPETFERSACSR